MFGSGADRMAQDDARQDKAGLCWTARDRAMRENGRGDMVKQNGVEARKTELCSMGMDAGMEGKIWRYSIVWSIVL
jgi:hypothetical protein